MCGRWGLKGGPRGMCEQGGCRTGGEAGQVRGHRGENKASWKARDGLSPWGK